MRYAPARHIVIKAEAVVVFAVLLEELVQGSSEVGAGRVVGVHPEAPIV
jgi:hypothetical protein